MHRMYLSMLVLLFVGFAGCADETAPVVPDDPFADTPSTVATGKGVIRGLVIDTTITPVAGALVTVTNTKLEATTGEDGLFRFADVAPGTYFLKISKSGWSPMQQSVNVVADVAKPDIIRVQIERVPGSEARAETFQDIGFIACGWGVPITYGYCGDELGQEDDYRLQYMVDGTPDFIQVEIIWESTQPLSDNLYLINSMCPPQNKDSCPGSIPAGKRWDEGTWSSPAIMRTPAGFVQGAMDQFSSDNTNEWWVGVDVSADGPALASGVTIDQEFRGYVTMFWNIEPSADWTFVNDGAYPY